MKLIRYSLLFWLPFFLKRALGYDEGTAGYLSTTFEAGGIVGALLIGWIADRFFTHNPLRLAAAVIFVLAGSFLLLRLAGPLGIWAVGANLALIGFLLFGPDTLLCGAVAQNLGREHATGSAAGLINGFGSTGAALQGLITAAVSQAWGWNALFLFFVGFALISAAALLPLAWRKRF
jgi:sugar phosphate permease